MYKYVIFTQDEMLSITQSNNDMIPHGLFHECFVLDSSELPAQSCRNNGLDTRYSGFKFG